MQKWNPTPEELDIIKRGHSVGMTYTQLSELLGISVSTFNRHRKSNPDMDRILSQAKSNVANKIAQTLVNKALSGDNTCMIFWLKSQCGWIDKPEATQLELVTPNFSFKKIEKQTEEGQPVELKSGNEDK